MRKYSYTFEFKKTEEEARAFCERINAGLTRYMRKNKPAHFAGYFQIAKGRHPAHDFPFSDILIFFPLSYLLTLSSFVHLCMETDSHVSTSIYFNIVPYRKNRRRALNPADRLNG